LDSANKSREREDERYVSRSQLRRPATCSRDPDDINDDSELKRSQKQEPPMLTIYLIIGALAGIMSGLFGVGGGVVVIPALSRVFMHYTTIPPAYNMQMAVGTSLAIMIFTAASALYAHHQRKSVQWGMFYSMVPGLIIGSVIGAIIAHFLPSFYLQIIFGVFLIFISFRLMINTPDDANQKGISLKIIRVSSVLIGAFSSLLGVGGGTLLIPFFLRCRLDMREAAGTSVACGLLIGIVATISFMVTGLSSTQHADWSTGYVYWPAFLGVAMASMLLAPLGAALAHQLPTALLKRIFGLFLFLMACDMLFFK